MFRILELQSLILTNVSHSGAPQLDLTNVSHFGGKQSWRSFGGALEECWRALEEVWRSSGGALEQLCSCGGQPDLDECFAFWSSKA